LVAVRPAAAAAVPHAARRPWEAAPAAPQEVAAAQAAPSAEVALDAPLGAVRAGQWAVVAPGAPRPRAEAQPLAAEGGRPEAVAVGSVSPELVDGLGAQRAWRPAAAQRGADPEPWTAPVLPLVAVEVPPA